MQAKRIIQWALNLTVVLSLAGCPPPDEPLSTTVLRDTVPDPRAELRGLGGYDPGAGLPMLGADACEIQELVNGVKVVFYRQFDDAGHLIRETEGAEDRLPVSVTVYRRDDDGRVVQRTTTTSTEAAEILNYVYDRAGRLVYVQSATSPRIGWSYSYTEQGVLGATTSTNTSGSVAYDISYAYTESGQLERKTLNFGGRRANLDIDYGYDAGGYLTSKLIRTRDSAQWFEQRYLWRNGLLVTIEGRFGEQVSLRYDNIGRLKQRVERSFDGPDVERLYRYDCE